MEHIPYIRINIKGKPLLSSSDGCLYQISWWSFFKILIGFENITRLDSWHVRMNRNVKKPIHIPIQRQALQPGQLWEMPDTGNKHTLQGVSLKLATVIADIMPPFSVDDRMVELFTEAISQALLTTVRSSDVPTNVVDAVMAKFSPEAEIIVHQDIYRNMFILGVIHELTKMSNPHEFPEEKKSQQ